MNSEYSNGVFTYYLGKEKKIKLNLTLDTLVNAR